RIRVRSMDRVLGDGRRSSIATGPRGAWPIPRSRDGFLDERATGGGPRRGPVTGRARRAAPVRRAVAGVLLAGLLPATSSMLLGGCTGPGWNEVRSARGDAEIARLDADLAEHRRTVALREATLAASARRLAELDAE